MNKDRKIREAQFHNNRYIEDKRERLSSIYDFAKNSKNIFKNIVTNVKSGNNILEIGCGINNVYNDFIKKGTNVTLIDISEKAIELAKKNNIDNKSKIKYILMDAENLKFNDNSFDLIYGTGILHHLSLEKAIIEINRVLKIGGKAIFYEPMGHNIFINMFRYLTPTLRSKDEHPLLIKDLDHIKTIFPKTRFHYFYLLSLIFFPLYKFKKITKRIEKLDEFINKNFTFLNRYNWITIIEITK